jgi:hypothetical protein
MMLSLISKRAEVRMRQDFKKFLFKYAVIIVILSLLYSSLAASSVMGSQSDLETYLPSREDVGAAFGLQYGWHERLEKETWIHVEPLYQEESSWQSIACDYPLLDYSRQYGPRIFNFHIELIEEEGEIENKRQSILSEISRREYTYGIDSYIYEEAAIGDLAVVERIWRVDIEPHECWLLECQFIKGKMNGLAQLSHVADVGEGQFASDDYIQAGLRLESFFGQFKQLVGSIANRILSYTPTSSHTSTSSTTSTQTTQATEATKATSTADGSFFENHPIVSIAGIAVGGIVAGFAVAGAVSVAVTEGSSLAPSAWNVGKWLWKGRNILKGLKMVNEYGEWVNQPRQVRGMGYGGTVNRETGDYAYVTGNRDVTWVSQEELEREVNNIKDEIDRSNFLFPGEKEALKMHLEQNKCDELEKKKILDAARGIHIGY